MSAAPHIQGNCWCRRGTLCEGSNFMSSRKRFSSRTERKKTVHLQLWPTGEPEDTSDLERFRPQTRAECERGIRPCPFVSCRWNLYLDLSPRNPTRVTLNFPETSPDEMPKERSCALDLADDGGLGLDAVGEAMNLSRERVRQIESNGAAKVALRAPHLAEALGLSPKVKTKRDEAGQLALPRRAVSPVDVANACRRAGRPLHARELAVSFGMTAYAMRRSLRYAVELGAIERVGRLYVAPRRVQEAS